jgi:ABC-type cobalt transport system substrate-binding protein
LPIDTFCVTVFKHLFGCSEETEDDEEPQYLKGDLSCPIHITSAPFLSSNDVCEMILNPGDKVCTKVPLACRKSATFVLDTSSFDHPDDFKADDNGSFRNNGTKYEFVELDDEGNVTRIEKPESLCQGQFKLSRTYWVHSSTTVFKRRVMTLEDHEGGALPMAILQYSNTGKEEDVKVEAHKNSKRNHQPYYASATSTRKRIEEKAKSQMGPSSIFDELYEIGGGIVESMLFASQPRGISQVKYERKKLRQQHSKDTLSEIIEQAVQW